MKATAQMGGLTGEEIENLRRMLVSGGGVVLTNEVNALCDLALRGIEVREFLEHWKADGHLQTFEDRERFRKDAASLLERFPPPPERP